MTSSAKTIEKVLNQIPDDARVLDVGGGKFPLLRATHVVDFLEYSKSAHKLGRMHGAGEPRFTADTWFPCNIDEEPLPFSDDFFDFVFCTHTLEDISNPKFALSEISRVGKAGYCETPSVFWELIMGIQLPTIVGAPHHKWYVEVDPSKSTFIFTPKGGHCYLSDEHHISNEAVQHVTEDNDTVGLFWQGAVHAEVNLMIDYVDNVSWVKSRVDALSPV